MHVIRKLENTEIFGITFFLGKEWMLSDFLKDNRSDKSASSKTNSEETSMANEHFNVEEGIFEKDI